MGHKAKKSKKSSYSTGKSSEKEAEQGIETVVLHKNKRENIVDSGTLQHIGNDLDSFADVEHIDSVSFHLVDDKFLLVIENGSVCMHLSLSGVIAETVAHLLGKKCFTSVRHL